MRLKMLCIPCFSFVIVLVARSYAASQLFAFASVRRRRSSKVRRFFLRSRSLDLPWPDFSFFPPLSAPRMPPHPLKTPRWQVAHPSLLALGAKLSFDDKIDRAVFTGNMKTSPNRRYIFNQAEHHPELLFVNEV